MNGHSCRSAVLAAACLIVTAQPADAKPAQPTAADTAAGQGAFLSVAGSPEFQEATRSGDWEAAKALMERQGISPHPAFPTQPIVCVPPYHIYYAWQWVLGPNGYHLAWLPKGCIRTARYEGTFFPFDE